MSEVYMIVHNPQCSKSAKALELLREKGVEPEIVDYLNGELSRSFLEKTLLALNKRPKSVLRKKEERFKELTLDLEDDQAVIDAILEHPILLERPIVIKDDKAVMARPPEKLESLF